MAYTKESLKTNSEQAGSQSKIVKKYLNDHYLATTLYFGLSNPIQIYNKLLTENPNPLSNMDWQSNPKLNEFYLLLENINGNIKGFVYKQWNF